MCVYSNQLVRYRCREELIGTTDTEIFANPGSLWTLANAAKGIANAAGRIATIARRIATVGRIATVVLMIEVVYMITINGIHNAIDVGGRVALGGSRQLAS